MMTENGYDRLRNAIVLQAVTDYRMAKKKLGTSKTKEAYLEDHRESISYPVYLKRIKACRDEQDKCRFEMERCEHFFLSDWYKFLTDVDGRRLLKKLQEET